MQENEWGGEQVLGIIKEIKECNGNIKELLRTDTLIKVMSRISNYMRYDIISKNEIITYKISMDISNDAENLFK